MLWGAIVTPPRRRWWLVGLLVAVWIGCAASDQQGFFASQLNAFYVARTFAFAGLLAVGQLLAQRRGLVDLSAGAVMAASCALAVSLGGVWPTTAVVAACLALGLASGLGSAALMLSTKVPRTLVTLLPAALAPLLLTAPLGGLAPDPLRQFATGSAGVWLPWLGVAALPILLLSLCAESGPARRRAARFGEEPRLLFSLASGGLLWALLGLYLAGLSGDAAVELWPVVLGLGLALLGRDAGAAWVLAAVAAMVLNRWGGGPGEGLGATLGDGQALVSAVVLLLGLLAYRPGSTDPDEADRGGADAPPPAVDDADAEPAGLVGLDRDQ